MCPVCDSGAKKTLNRFLNECQGLSSISERHETKQEVKIEELLLFCGLDKKRIDKRKKYL